MTDFPRIVTRDQLRFDILLGVQRVSSADLRDWTGKDRMKREGARQRIVDTVLEQLLRYEVRAREPIQPPIAPDAPIGFT